MTDPASVYLDHAATTPLDDRVARAMHAARDAAGLAANPSSPHPAGRRAAQQVEGAREQVLTAVNAPDYALTWTSGATEADNLAILGLAMASARRHSGRVRLLLTATEHPAVMAAARAAQALGFRVETLPVRADGRLDCATLAGALDDDVALVSVAQVNSETGVVQPLAELAPLVHEAGARLHVDAAQGAGRLPLDVQALGVDLLALSAHKFYGPKGVGALCHHPDVRLEPLLHGGGQQDGLRPGTLPVELIAGMGEAFAMADSDAERARLRRLHAQLYNALEPLGGVIRNGRPDGSPHVLNLSFAGVHGLALREALAPLQVGFGSACSSGGTSPVLRAMGRPDALAHASVRFSPGRSTTAAGIEAVADEVAGVVQRLREASPLWRELSEGRPLHEVYGVSTPLGVA